MELETINWTNNRNIFQIKWIDKKKCSNLKFYGAFISFSKNSCL